MTLHRYVKKKKECSEQEAGRIRLTPNYANRTVFNAVQENALQEYLITCSQMFYGLDTIECRKLAYEMAFYYKLNIPKNWEDKKMAGVDWLYGLACYFDVVTLCPVPCIRVPQIRGSLLQSTKFI